VRWALISAAVAVCAGIAAVLLTGAFAASRRHGTASTPSAALIAGRTPVASAAPPARWGLETGAQTAAVRRLAVHGLPLYCGASRKPVVALTFDDGPGVYTHLAIKKLREYHLVATFFLVGKEIHAWPGWAQREEPYAVFGDHTMTHPFLPALPQAQMRREISRAQSLIERTVGEPVVLFRPPYEGHTPAIDREARALRMLEILWSVDSQDSLGANYAGIERNVVAGLRPGAIILMHENRGQTIRALATIFGALHRRHLQAVTVPELVAEDAPSLAQLRAGVGGCGARPAAGNGS
jgi:peptidoglycan-N-acetylglucosamine deacetylase